jgi:hypothetical protein
LSQEWPSALQTEFCTYLLHQESPYSHVALVIPDVDVLALLEVVVEAVILHDKLARYGKPEIFNTDQGSQFTSIAFTGLLVRSFEADHGVQGLHRASAQSLCKSPRERRNQAGTDGPQQSDGGPGPRLVAEDGVLSGEL